MDIDEAERRQYLEMMAFFTNAQVRLLNIDRKILEDTGPPEKLMTLALESVSENQSYTEDQTQSGEIISGTLVPQNHLTEEALNPYPDANVFYFDVTDPSLFPVFDFGYAGVVSNEIDAVANGPRSGQVITIPYYDREGNLLGYVELSKGPAYGREILQSVAWGWAIAALAAILLAAAAGMWISRRFSTPLERLTRTTTQMAAGDLSARTGVQRLDEFGLLADSFNQMADNVEAKVAALRCFVADAAHELGTPLTALRTNLELVDDEHIPPALEQVRRMDALTRSLLDLSRLEAAAPEMQLDEVDLVAILRDLAEPYASRADQAELNFDLEIEAGPVEIKGDAAQLHTLIRNLLDNAIKFTPAGGQVQVKLSAQDDAVQLTVADTGIGIPDDEHSHLFLRFHRGRNAAAYPGSGLGLAIVKAIIDQHEASIEVESDQTGTQFMVAFQS
jgi:signal transduction histidine kinase